MEEQLYEFFIHNVAASCHSPRYEHNNAWIYFVFNTYDEYLWQVNGTLIAHGKSTAHSRGTPPPDMLGKQTKSFEYLAAATIWEYL